MLEPPIILHPAQVAGKPGVERAPADAQLLADLVDGAIAFGHGRRIRYVLRSVRSILSR
jgi:hypothetical protein